MAGAKFLSGQIQSPHFRECWSFTNLILETTMKTGWSKTGTNSPAGYGPNCYSIKLTGTTSLPEVLVNTYSSIQLNNTHIYYARVYGKQDVACGSVGFYWPIEEPSIADGIPVKAAGSWQMYSAINNRSTFSNGRIAQFRLDFNNNNQAGDMWFSSPMLIDLTDTFGSGNEPNQAWCDTNIPYFERNYSIPVTKIASILANEMQSMKFTETSGLSITTTGVYTGLLTEQ